MAKSSETCRYRRTGWCQHGNRFQSLVGTKGVSEEMREKIKNLAEELGYRSPSETKRQSAEKQYNIGVLIQEVYLDKYNSFYWRMYQEVNKKAVSVGVFTLLESISRESVLENQMPLLLQEKKGGWSDYSRRYDKAVH